MILVRHWKRDLSPELTSQLLIGMTVPVYDETELVAALDTDDLDAAYEATQHIDKPWTEGPLVMSHKIGVRSSAVGDMFGKLDRATQHIDWYAVASIGFREVPLFSVGKGFGQRRELLERLNKIA